MPAAATAAAEPAVAQRFSRRVSISSKIKKEGSFSDFAVVRTIKAHNHGERKRKILGPRETP